MWKRLEQERLKKIYDKTHTSFVRGVYYDTRKHRYIRYYASNTPGYTKYLRKQCNKKIRQSNDIFRGGQYRKMYEYWWRLI